ncbi:MAG: translation initiation factor [Luteolibacter sp.]
MRALWQSNRHQTGIRERLETNKRELRGIRGWMARMSRNKGSKTTSEGEGLVRNPFEVLGGLGGLPAGPGVPQDFAPVVSPKTSQRGLKNTNRGRVDIVRQTAHRGGRGVTVARNFVGIGLPEKLELAKLMQKACGVGGTVKDGCIEIQGDKREEMKRILTEAGFKPVFAGG